jgi:hypothetical protein
VSRSAAFAAVATIRSATAAALNRDNMGGIVLTLRFE